MCVQVFWSFGSYYVSLLRMVLVPDFGWRLWVAVTISPMILLIPLITWLPESPRYLLIHNRLEEAIEVVNEIAAMNNSPPITGIRHAMSKKSNFTDMFHQKYILTTIITAYVCFVSGLSYYGFVFSSSIINDIPHICLQDFSAIFDPSMFTNVSLDNSCCFTQSWNQIKTVLISITGELLSYVVGIVIVQLISRKLFLQILLLVTTSVYILLNLCLSSVNIGLLMMFGRGSTGILLRINLLYISEVFPTSIRSLTIGMSNSLVRIGGMCSSLLVNMIMVKKSFLAFTVFYGVINIIGFILIIFLPYETKDRILAQSVEDDVSDSDRRKLKQ